MALFHRTMILVHCNNCTRCNTHTLTDCPYLLWEWQVLCPRKDRHLDKFIRSHRPSHSRDWAHFVTPGLITREDSSWFSPDTYKGLQPPETRTNLQHRTVRATAKHVPSSRWVLPYCYHTYLHSLDPNLMFCAPRGLQNPSPRTFGCWLHHEVLSPGQQWRITGFWDLRDTWHYWSPSMWILTLQSCKT